MPQPEAQPLDNSRWPAGKPEAFRRVLRHSRTNPRVIKDCLEFRVGQEPDREGGLSTLFQSMSRSITFNLSGITSPFDLKMFPPDWHREILAERLAAHHADRNQGKNWEEFEKDLTAELNNRTR